jgi:prolyl-tRNA synthetase
MPDGKALQMGTSHHLGQNFSKPFDIKFIGEDTVEHLAWQTSWGVSWRLIGALVMVHGDDKGLILPPKVAPIQIVIVPIYRDKDAEKVKTFAAQVARDLVEAGYRCHLDDRDQYTSAWKFNEWEMKGVPLRINLGPRDIDNQQVEFVRRDSREKIIKKQNEMIGAANELLTAIQDALYQRAKAFLDGNIFVPASYEQFKSELESHGGFFRVGWCGMNDCEVKIKEETGADIRVLPFEQNGLRSSSCCIRCGQPAKKLAILARAY